MGAWKLQGWLRPLAEITGEGAETGDDCLNSKPYRNIATEFWCRIRFPPLFLNGRAAPPETDERLRPRCGRRSLAGDRQIERVVRLARGSMIDEELRFCRVDVGVVVEILESVGSDEAQPGIVAQLGKKHHVFGGRKRRQFERPVRAACMSTLTNPFVAWSGTSPRVERLG